jgi:hypothetical protein
MAVLLNRVTDSNTALHRASTIRLKVSRCSTSKARRRRSRNRRKTEDVWAPGKFYPSIYGSARVK